MSRKFEGVTCFDKDRNKRWIRRNVVTVANSYLIRFSSSGAVVWNVRGEGFAVPGLGKRATVES